MARPLPACQLLALLALALLAGRAEAIPPFARKYGTACQTCHTVYPKLNRFGEEFRRRGLRFPGVDQDQVREEPIALGQEELKQVFPGAVWPGLLPASLPLGLGAGGRAAAHPDVRSGAALAAGGAPFSLQDLVAEVHLWAGGSLDEAITFFAEVTASTRGTVEVENVELKLWDLAGPPGVLGLTIGQAWPTLTSFGAHSSYLADQALPSAPVAALLGVPGPGFALGGSAPGLELQGLAFEHLTYAAGVAAGATADARPTLKAWAHLGGLWAGDGPGPWKDALLGVDLFGVQATSRLGLASGTVEDSAWVAGGALRLGLGPVELDAGLYRQWHSRADFGPALAGPGLAAAAWVHHDELSWVALPWLVPVVRLEYLALEGAGPAPAAWNLRVLPGVAVLFRQNLKASLVVRLEAASGVVPGGWTPAGGFAAPAAALPQVPLELEAVELNLAAAF